MGENNLDNLKILFVGDDEGYYDDIKKCYEKTYPDQLFSFINTYDPKDPNHYNAFVKVLKESPSIIYVDISSKNPFMVRLAQFLRRQQQLRGAPVVALLKDKEKIPACRDAGIKFIYVKCAEIHDVVYHPYLYINPEKAKTNSFAIGKFELDSYIYDEVKVGFVENKYAHIESMQNLHEGSEVEFIHPLLKRYLKSQTCTVKNTTTHNLFYNMDYGLDLYFSFLEEPDYEIFEKTREEEMQKVLNNQGQVSPEELEFKRFDLEKKFPSVETLKKDIQKEKEKLKDQLHDWIIEFKDLFRPKKTKVVIIDKGLGFLENNQFDLSEWAFTLSVQSKLDLNYNIIEKIMPNVIAYTFPLVGSDNEIEELETIQSLVSHINEMENYQPIILFYKCGKASSEFLQKKYDYSSIISNGGSISLAQIINMGHIYESKLQEKKLFLMENKLKKYEKGDGKLVNEVMSIEFEEDRNYLSKDKCHGLIKHPVTLTSLSESEITFSSLMEFNLGTFKLEDPIIIYITLVPIEGKVYSKDGAKFNYRGILHGLDEIGKKELRKQVDKIFLKDKAESQSEELKVFEEAKNKALEKKSEKE